MPAAQPSSGGGGQSDNSTGLLWILAAVFAGVGVIWYFFKSYIVKFFLYVKLYELDFLSFISSTFHISATYFDPLRATILNALLAPENVSFNDLLNIGNGVGDWLRFPFVVIMFILAFVVYFSNASRSFRHTYDMRSLSQSENVIRPLITPVVGLDLVKTDIDKGPWAMAMTPMQFSKRHKLLDEVRPERREGMSRRDWNRIEVVLKRGEANKVFALQLGPVWRGTEQLPPHTRALFAAFAARINADSEPAAALLSQLAASCLGKLDLTGVDELLKKHENTKLVQQVVQSHAYVSTVMASMLQAAREDGVQAAADFLWIKPIDRRLWYTLNTVGRQTPFIEVAGIFAHWVSEKDARHRLLVPVIEEATNALELALKDIIYIPDEEV